MDYEKEYKSFVAKVKKAHQFAQTDSTKSVLEDILPQLRESENERIRRTLVEYFGRYNPEDKWDDEFSFKDVLSYLEKQKEQKPTIWTEEDEKNLCELLAYGETHLGLRRWIAGLPEKIKGLQQRPAEWSEEDERILKGVIGKIDHDQTYGVSKAEMLSFLKSLRQQPKQEWIEEEKQKLNRIYVILGQAADTHAFSTTCRLIGDKEAVELQDFIRSIAKPQAHEWSKEDENKIERLAFLISVAAEKEMISTEECIDLRRFVKSYRPSWKPSEEQMGALSWMLENARANIDFDPLKDLYEQLKKL